MGQPQPKIRISPQEYLCRERASEFKSEFLDGEIFAMSGGTPRHSLIKANVICELCNRLKGHPCTAYDSDLRVKVEATGLYAYPDASVICGPLEYDDERSDTVLNPTLLVEVLSPSTEAFDRGKKLNHYRRIESLQEYLLISQDEPRIQRYLRNADNTWTLTDAADLAECLHLPSLGIELSLGEVYAKVDFSQAADEMTS
jgi:Uma2 family endonuclease